MLSMFVLIGHCLLGCWVGVYCLTRQPRFWGFREGGIRVNSWISGGFLPAHMRSTKHNGLVTAWDFYATLCSFAGVDPTDHRAAAIDSHSRHRPAFMCCTTKLENVPWGTIFGSAATIE